MKNLFIVLVVVASLAGMLGLKKRPTPGMKYTIYPGGDYGVIINGASYQPGDTLVFDDNGTGFSYVFISNLQGTAQNKIVLINKSGQRTRLWNGFDLYDCQYFKLTGTGSQSHQYGFYINQFTLAGQNGVGVNIHGRSAHGLVENMHFDTVGYAFWLKNEKFCDSLLQYWVLDDFELRNMRVENVNHHSAYLGATERFNNSRPEVCNGVGKYFNPSPLGNIKVHDWIIRDLGKNGMMLSGASVGFSEIYNLDIDSTGNQLQTDQGTGISLGGFDNNIYVHDNIVRSSWLWGITSFGGQNVRIENNTVMNSGLSKRSGTTQNWPHLISIGAGPQYNEPMTFIIKNNTLSNPAVDAYGIKVESYAGYTTNNIICGNTGTLSVVNGVTYSTNCTANLPPAVSVGSNQTITLPTSQVTLTASATAGAGSITTYSWTRVSGPNIPIFSSQVEQQITVSNLVQGQYQFRIMVQQTDGQTAQATVNVFVNAAPTSNNRRGKVVVARKVK